MGWTDCKWKGGFGGGGNIRGGGLPPGGDLISEISLSLTKLSVKQSLVGNRAGGLGWGEGGQEWGTLRG